MEDNDLLDMEFEQRVATLPDEANVTSTMDQVVDSSSAASNTILSDDRCEIVSMDQPEGVQKA